MKEQLKIKRVFESGKRGRGRPRKGFLYSFPFPIKVKRQPGQELKFIVTPKEAVTTEAIPEESAEESEGSTVSNNSTTNEESSGDSDDERSSNSSSSDLHSSWSLDEGASLKKDLGSGVKGGRQLAGVVVTRGIRKTYVCNNCPRKFRRKCSLLSHKIAHRSIALVLREGGGGGEGGGGKKVKVVPKPRLHFRWAYLCEKCGDKFLLKVDLERHQERLHKERTILCDVSGNWFSNEDSMVEHQVLVKTEPEWVCGECGEGFGGRLSLSVHEMKAHKKVAQRVRCVHCPKTFSRIDNMLRHVEGFHITNPNNFCPKVYNCPNSLCKHAAATHKNSALTI